MYEILIYALSLMMFSISYAKDVNSISLDSAQLLCNGYPPNEESESYLNQLIKYSAETCSYESLADARKEVEIVKKAALEAKEELDRIYNLPVIDVGDFKGKVLLTPSNLHALSSAMVLILGGSIIVSKFFKLSPKSERLFNKTLGWLVVVGMLSLWLSKEGISENFDEADQYAEIIKKFDETNITENADFRNKVYLTRENLGYIRSIVYFHLYKALQREKILNAIQNVKYSDSLDKEKKVN